MYNVFYFKKTNKHIGNLYKQLHNFLRAQHEKRENKKNLLCAEAGKMRVIEKNYPIKISLLNFFFAFVIKIESSK